MQAQFSVCINHHAYAFIDAVVITVDALGGDAGRHQAWHGGQGICRQPVALLEEAVLAAIGQIESVGLAFFQHPAKSRQTGRGTGVVDDQRTCPGLLVVQDQMAQAIARDRYFDFPTVEETG